MREAPLSAEPVAARQGPGQRAADQPPTGLLLLQLGAYPDEIAATQVQTCRDGGAFFLDFSRPLQRLRWLGVWNTRVGYTMSLTVPVVHQGEHPGTRTIAVDRIDPYYRELQRLWQTRYPKVHPAPAMLVAQPQVDADFAAQFPRERGADPRR